jgi:hypothetical protein
MPSSARCAAWQDRGRGRLVDLAALDPDQAVLDVVDAPDAVGAAQRVQPVDELDRGSRSPSSATGSRPRTLVISTGAGAADASTVHS